MNKFTLLLLGAFLLLYSQVIAQQNHDILLQTVIIDDTEKLTPQQIAKQDLSRNKYEEHYYLILQFEDIPTATLRKKLQDEGIKLLGYLPNLAYWASVPSRIDLSTLPTRAIIIPKPSYKLALSLYHHVYNQEDTLLLQAFPFPNISTERLSKQLTKAGLAVEKIDARYIQLRVPTDRVLSLAAFPAIMYLEETPPERYPEDIVARSLHGIHPLSNGPRLGLDGAGVVISTADDGIAIHPDLKNRVISHLDTDDPKHHSDMVLGILTGAGNIDQTALGMAPQATVHLYDIRTYDHIDKAVANFEAYGATITSTSYAEGCGGLYNSSASKIDEQVYQNPFLLHCFSAGNEAAETCSDVYGHLSDAEGYSYGNITGGQKAAKNVIAVGNLHYNDQLMRMSSRGPANDGRIKPDLCAYGQGQRSTYPDDTYRQSGGSSAAVPVVAGAAAVLTQLYREQRQTDIIPSDLLKPIMLNTTEDLGPPGPDFKYGWGRLQIQRAAETLLHNQYLKAGIANRQENIHSINIPDNVFDLRIMLYWHDPAANPTAGKALVNDLDLTVQPANSLPIRPWVLSTATQMDSINKPAYHGLDRINNVEQVSIDFPKGGNYQIRVKGHLVPEGPQLYYIVYSFRRKALNLTYPLGGESFSPGENQVIRWDAFGNNSPFDLEYRLQGQGWKAIARNLSPLMRHLNWHVPDQINGLAEIRISNDNDQDQTLTTFSILAQPVFDFLYQTDQLAWITWAPVEGADSYDVFMLGEQYMEIIGSTSVNRFQIQTDPDKINWYSVRARKSDGPTSRRALAKRYLNLPCEANIGLKFQFDAYPSETEWQLRNEMGLIIAKGGSYNEQTGNTQLEINTCVPLGCYELIVMDSYGDGLCCLGGQGYYEMTDETGRILAYGATFVHEDRTDFCLDIPPDPPTTEPLAIEILDYKHVKCAGDATGQVLVQASGGHGTYAYHWSNGQIGSNLQNVLAGSYRVTVTDGFSNLTKLIPINEPAPLRIALDINSDNCQPDVPGQVSATVTGGSAPFQYFWNTGSSSRSLNQLPPGLYTLTVTDANGCQASAQTVLLSSIPINIEATITPVSNAHLGSIHLQVTGGAPSYRYRWSDGTTSASLSGLPGGEYTVTVTDDKNCTLSRTFIVPDESTDTEISYCSASGAHADQEWIASITVNNVLFPSGNNQGYRSYIDQPVSVATGQAFELELERGHKTNSKLHYWSVWIDFNQNGRLDDLGELVFQNTLLQDTHLLQIQVPAGLNGQTRMRVAMQWGFHPGPCGSLTWGEVEDFTLDFGQTESVNMGKTTRLPPPEPVKGATPQIQISPNPTRYQFQLIYRDLPAGTGLLFLMNSQGQQIQKWKWEEELIKGAREINLPAQLSSGIYHLRLQIGQWYDAKRLMVK